MLIKKYIILVKTILLLSIKDKKLFNMHLYVYNYIRTFSFITKQFFVEDFKYVTMVYDCLIDRLYKNYTKGRLLGINDIQHSMLINNLSKLNFFV